MAVQAQYPSNAFRIRSNVLEDFQHQNINSNLFGGYNNYAGVLSDPESELTCNVSGSRKRNREEKIALDQRQMLPYYLQPQESQQFRFGSANLSNGQVFDSKATDATSTGFQISYEESRLNGSLGTSTSGRSPISPHLSWITQDVNSLLLHQNLEIETLILLQNEKIRSLEETRKRHCSSLLSVLEQKVLKILKSKEVELENASKRHAELEEKVNRISAENQMWFNVAKNNEVIISSLRSSIDEILHQTKKQNREGFGDSGDGISVPADDAESCCYEGVIEEDKSAMAERTIRENLELKQRKSCKVCRENEISVLILPCRHLCLCKNCESKIDSCPICKATKNASLQVFVS